MMFYERREPFVQHNSSIVMQNQYSVNTTLSAIMLKTILKISLEHLRIIMETEMLCIHFEKGMEKHKENSLSFDKGDSSGFIGIFSLSY